MAQVERGQEERRAGKRERAKEKRGRARRSEGQFQVTLADWAVLAALTQALATRGGALRVGLTRDGGALALGVYYEDDYATEYVRPSEDLWTAAGEIAEAWLPEGTNALVAALEQTGTGAWLK